MWSLLNSVIFSQIGTIVMNRNCSDTPVPADCWRWASEADMMTGSLQMGWSLWQPTCNLWQLPYMAPEMGDAWWCLYQSMLASRMKHHMLMMCCWIPDGEETGSLVHLFCTGTLDNVWRNLCPPKLKPWPCRRHGWWGRVGVLLQQLHSSLCTETAKEGQEIKVEMNVINQDIASVLV